MKYFGLIFGLLISLKSNAYFSTIDTGEILAPGVYRASAEPQINVTGPATGFDLTGRFDVGVNDSSNFRAELGFGAVAFESALYYKWIPIPDIDNQPALGVMLGTIYGRYSSNSYLSLRAHPIISKEFEIDFGKITPYATIPFGVTSGPSTTYPSQLEFGAELKPKDLNKWSFFTEIGFNINDSFGYVSAAVAYYFDDRAFVPRKKQPID